MNPSRADRKGESTQHLVKMRTEKLRSKLDGGGTWEDWRVSEEQSALQHLDRQRNRPAGLQKGKMHQQRLNV